MNRKAARDLRAALSTFRVGDPPILTSVGEQIAAVAGAEASATYAIEEDAIGGTGVSFAYFTGCTDRSTRLLGTLLERHGAGVLPWEASRVPVPHRNTVINLDELRRFMGKAIAENPIYRDLVIRENGFGDQLRVLLAEGPRQLAFVGVFLRDRRFDDDAKRAFSRIVPTLRRRLLHEERMAQAELALAALPTALDALPTAAFLLDTSGRVRVANILGRALLRCDSNVTSTLRDAARAGAHPAFAVYNLFDRGRASPYLLCIATAARHPAPGVARRTADWGLTPRQAEVLELVARGWSNKSIAVALGCATGTVGIHVSALLDKAQVASRMELMAAVLDRGAS